MNSNDAAMAKAVLRKQLRAKRAEHRPTHADIASLCSRLIDLVGDSAIVAAYLPITGEPDIRAFINHCSAAGKTVLLPRVVGEDLDWVIFEGQTSVGELGFTEATGAAAKLSDANVIIVPALGVDKQGMRIGKGRGYYDRALEHSSATVAAVVFAHEVIDVIQHEAHDRHVDAVVTPAETIWF